MTKSEGDKFKLVGFDKKRRCSRHNCHYLFITDINKFLISLQKYTTQTTDFMKKHFSCINCMHCLSTKDALQSHQDKCFLNKPQRVEMPDPGSKLMFRNFSRTVMCPIYATCDFEAAMVDVKEPAEIIENNQGKTRYVENIMKHEAITASIVFITSQGIVLDQLVFSEPNNEVIFRFYKELEMLWEKWSYLFKDRPDCPVLTPAQNKAYHSAKHCYLCKKEFGHDDDYELRKVRDHSHSSLDDGKYLGPAHAYCNRQRTYQSVIHVFVHNLTRYDSSFLIQGLGDKRVIRHMRKNGYNIKAVPTNTEHFRTISLYNYTFLDSFSFLSIGLQKLVEELGEDHEFPLMKQMRYKQIRARDIDMSLLRRKSVFPYEWCRSYEQLLSSTSFPNKKDFFSHLTQKDITDEDYAHGQKMFNLFNCSNMLEYAEIYCLIDCLLLAEVIKNYRDATYDEFGLDICHYISSPQLSFDVMLKETGVEIHLISDVDMFIFIESALRGGLSYVSERHVKLNDDYDPSTSKEWLGYFDINNLYGFTMMDYLPIKNFTWVTEKEFLSIDWTATCDSQPVGYILEVDLFVPSELHDYFESFPLAAETYSPNFEDLSAYSQMTLKETYTRKHYQNGKPVGAAKLCGTFLPKKKYIVHYSNLRLFLELGIQLDQIHRALKFEQSPWLRDYVTRMTHKRINAKSEFAKTHYKLLINSLYGKFLQNVRAYRHAVFVTSSMLLNRHAMDPTFEQFRILGEECVIFYCKKKEVVLDKAYACGFSVLEKSKYYVAWLYYNHFLKAFGGHEKCTVVMSDTDSYLLHVEGITKNEAMDRLKNIMDFSNYPELHFLYSSSKKAIPGLVKDESKGNHIIEVVALRSKLYNHIVKKGEFCDEKDFEQPSARMKSIPRVAAKKIEMQQFRDALDVGTLHRAKTHTISSKHFQLSTVESLKLAISPYDDKRFILNCGIHSVPYGSYKIEKYGNVCMKCKINCDEQCNCKLNCKK